MSTLEERFKRFLSTLPGAENVDEVIPSGSFPNRERADYLLQNRKIVIELKSLQTDTSHKIEKELAIHRDREDFPLMYGEVELKRLLSHLPDGRDINRRIYRNVTRSIEEAVKKAERQITDTENILGLKHTAGLLVILNQSIEILDPTLVVRRISELLCNRSGRSTPNSSIDFVWLLLESHSIKLDGMPEGNLSTLLEGTDSSSFDWFFPYFDVLQRGWSNFCGQKLYSSPHTKRIDELSFRPVSKKVRKEKGLLKRYEADHQQYDLMPYLQHKSDAELRAHGDNVYRSLRAFFKKGAIRRSESEFKALKLAWSHFLRETQQRGIDFTYLRQTEADCRDADES
ncbi:MAG: hypothetical protein H8K05_00055 [Nitrospira sp.]|nr:hypothetical protein [Nitrospira sp.]